MVLFLLLIIYVALAFWAATQAKHTRAGLIGSFVLSLLATPVLSIIFLYAYAPPEEKGDLVAHSSSHGSEA